MGTFAIVDSFSEGARGLGMNSMEGQIAFYAILALVTSFVFIAGFMSLALMESWMVINVSVLFMGLGGSEWTRQYARQQLTYALAVGVKLFVMTLLIGLIMSVVDQWKAALLVEKGDIIEVHLWTLFGVSILAAFFVKTIPDMAQSLITGAAASAAGATTSIETTAQSVIGYPQRYGGGSGLGGNPGGGGGVSPSGTGTHFADIYPPPDSYMGTPFRNTSTASTSRSSPVDIFAPVPVKDPSEVPTMAEVEERLGIRKHNPSPSAQNTNSGNKGESA